MRQLVAVLLLASAFAAFGSPLSRSNDGTCDISVAPAATLLLPYFEVDLDDPAKATTIFTITNVGSLPRIARVTIWTDYAYPVLTFDAFLTGYDIQTIRLHDVLAFGKLPAVGGELPDPGQRSADNDANEQLDTSRCSILPSQIPPRYVADLRSALTTGRVSACGNAPIGSVHARAIGYVTVDVVGNCNSTMPTEPSFYSEDLRYDNVLTGDYQQISAAHARPRAIRSCMFVQFRRADRSAPPPVSIARSIAACRAEARSIADNRCPLRLPHAGSVAAIGRWRLR